MCEKILLSVIVPVYNACSYLAELLDDLKNQTVFGYLDIVLVNDGSNDESRSLCQQFADAHENVILVDQPHTGVSAARNRGIVFARGLYTTFLDADDRIEHDLYEKELFLIQDASADIGMIDFYKLHRNGRKIKYRKNFKKSWSNRRDATKAFFRGEIGGQVVDKIFRTSLIKELRFPEKYRIGEDMFFVLKAIEQAQTVVMDTMIGGYTYVVREGSAMTGTFNQHHLDAVRISREMYDQYVEDHKLSEAAKAHWIHECCKALEYIYAHDVEKCYKDEVENLRKALREYPVVEAKNNLVFRQFLGFLLMRMMPRSYMLVHRLKHIG